MPSRVNPGVSKLSKSTMRRLTALKSNLCGRRILLEATHADMCAHRAVHPYFC